MLPAWSERITFSANSMTGTAGNSSDTTTLSGSAYVLTSSMEIAADSITMSGKNFRYIEADGNITGKNIEANMEFTCGRLSYDRETKIATLKDNDLELFSALVELYEERTFPIKSPSLEYLR